MFDPTLFGKGKHPTAMEEVRSISGVDRLSRPSGIEQEEELITGVGQCSQLLFTQYIETIEKPTRPLNAEKTKARRKLVARKHRVRTGGVVLDGMNDLPKDPRRGRLCEGVGGRFCPHGYDWT